MIHLIYAPFHIRLCNCGPFRSAVRFFVKLFLHILSKRAKLSIYIEFGRTE